VKFTEDVTTAKRTGLSVTIQIHLTGRMKDGRCEIHVSWTLVMNEGMFVMWCARGKNSAMDHKVYSGTMKTTTGRSRRTLRRSTLA
jgi:hypothetical protein